MKLHLSKRHIIKSVTWRIIGTLDTLLIASIVSDNLSVGVSISLIDLITKMVLYYIHERLWFKSFVSNSNLRHVLKTFSWRIIGTLDTFLITFLITGNPMIGFKVSGIEMITKMFLYYVHERLWYRSKFGLINN